MSYRMTIEEREQFLAGVHVGIVSIDEPGRGPLAVPIWYDYEPGGEVWFVTDSDSAKGRLLTTGGRISLCVQTEAPPYQYVSVEGPIASIESADLESDTRPMAHRYLGQENGDAYIASTQDSDRGSSIVVRLAPERWLSVDYGKAGSSA